MARKAATSSPITVADRDRAWATEAFSGEHEGQRDHVKGEAFHRQGGGHPTAGVVQVEHGHPRRTSELTSRRRAAIPAAPPLRRTTAFGKKTAWWRYLATTPGETRAPGVSRNSSAVRTIPTTRRFIDGPWGVPVASGWSRA